MMHCTLPLFLCFSFLFLPSATWYCTSYEKNQTLISDDCRLNSYPLDKTVYLGSIGLNTVMCLLLFFPNVLFLTCSKSELIVECLCSSPFEYLNYIPNMMILGEKGPVGGKQDQMRSIGWSPHELDQCSYRSCKGACILSLLSSM